METALRSTKKLPSTETAPPSTGNIVQSMGNNLPSTIIAIQSTEK
ncbi:hypothetical protein [Rummeliibacillus sp. SL167]|nr:hypothetical protein [Rummeliibacillus sp. SL167]